MLLGDVAIKKLLDIGVIRVEDENGTKVSPEKLYSRIDGPVTYDLVTRRFFIERYNETDTYTLEPNASVFVDTEEIIKLPDNLAATILIKNSRMRQGLSLDAPLYFPGHETRVFFRVTNVSSNEIVLDAKKPIAQIAFQEVSPVEKPYHGTFAQEFNFKGMGDYESSYSKELKKFSDKSDDLLHSLEKNVYANMLAIMAIFAAIFSLVNVNLMAFMSKAAGSIVIVANLTTIGSFAFLAAAIGQALRQKDEGVKAMPWVVAIVAFAAAVVVYIVTQGA